MTVIEVPVHPSHLEPKKAITRAVRGRINGRRVQIVEACLRKKGKNTLTIKREIRDWINEMAEKHWAIVQHGESLILRFHGKQDAMVYKLAWYGMDV